MRIIDKINRIDFKEDELNSLLQNLDNLIEKLANSSSFEREQIITKINALRDHYLTLYWCSYLGYLKNIKDEKYLQSEELFGKIDSQYNNLIYRYYSLIGNDAFIPIVGKRTVDIAHNQSILLNSANDPLIKREKELCREYRKLIISVKGMFEGEEVTLSQLDSKLNDTNRETRKKAYDTRYAILSSLSPDIERIMLELLNVRTQIANNLNLDNYTQYGFIKMNRLGYSEEDINTFRENIIKHFVPLLDRLRKEQQKRCNLESINYYDEKFLFPDGNAQIKYSLEELIELLKDIFKIVNNDLSSLFNDMYKGGLIDLEDREDKSKGGLTTYLPDFQYPTFIKKYLGLEDNFTSITHEFGHSTQLFYSKDKKYHENRWPTFDICEIHSTCMELLLYPYLDKIFGKDTSKYCISHLERLVELIIKMCAIDEFQSRLYREKPSTPEAINQLWKNIYLKYYPNNNYKHSYYELGIMWQSDINRFDDAFYGIDYSLDTICALSFYQKSLRDKENAFKEYIELCQDGGEISLKEIIDKYKLSSPFKESDIKDLSIFLENEIKKYSLELK